MMNMRVMMINYDYSYRYDYNCNIEFGIGLVWIVAEEVNGKLAMPTHTSL